MKTLKHTLAGLTLCLFTHNASAQIEGANAFLMGPTVQLGVHMDGFEGSSTLPSWPTAYRGMSGRLGFLSNADDNAWATYDGDFFMPGAPENRFGIEIDGTTYFNSSVMGSSIPGAISSYEEFGRCKYIVWNGSVGGVDIEMSYKLDTTTTYYTVNVILENTTASDLSDVYFYKALDPDNNQEIGWGFSTQNTIVSQPDSDTASLCPKALVTATAMGVQTDGSFTDNYLGLGSLDSNTRVATGGFYVMDASDVWNGVGGMIGVAGYSLLADQAISICHKDQTLAAGATSEFQFVVIMSEAQLPQALLKFFTLEYDDAPGFTGYCEDSLLIGPGYFTIWSDDTLSACSVEPVEMWIDGPDMDSYNWEWIDDNGDTIAYGPVALIIPGTEPGIYDYCCIGTPLPGTCADDMDVVVSFCKTMEVLQSPELVIGGIDVVCGDSLLLSDVLITDTAGVIDPITTYHSDFPTDFDDMDALWTSAYVNANDTVYVMMVDTATDCYDVAIITYTPDTVYAGLNEISSAVCNSELLLNLNDLLVGADTGGDWEDANTPPTGAVDPGSGILDLSAVDAGSYTFLYIVGGDPCPSDTSELTIDIYDQATAGSDVSELVCVPDVSTIDLDDLIDGDPGGSWEELDWTREQFDETTGLFTTTDLVPGEYNFLYIVESDGPCVDDTAYISIFIVLSPTAAFVYSPDVITIDDTEVSFTNNSVNADSYFWTFGDGEISSLIDPVHTYASATGTYEVWLYAYNMMGCSDSTSVLIEILDYEEDEEGDDDEIYSCFYVPNSFTPDGDNLNKEFKPIVCEDVDIYDFHMTIYNRWGEIVFETYHFDKGWKGDYGDGETVQDGIYIWQAEFGVISSDKKYMKQGHITVLR